ncbi:hypothetical protein ACHWQZ_G002710 [Mnemiopsis leidyi]
MGDWSHSIFSCFDDIGTCAITYLMPCYTYARNAQRSDTTNCLVAAVLFFVPFVNIFCWLKIRGNIREKHHIEGGVVTDLMMILCCGLCALVQEAQQLDEDPMAAAHGVVRN